MYQGGLLFMKPHLYDNISNLSYKQQHFTGVRGVHNQVSIMRRLLRGMLTAECECGVDVMQRKLATRHAMTECVTRA